MTLEKKPFHQDHKTSDDQTTQDSFQNRVIHKISSSYSWIFFHEKRGLIVAATSFLIVICILIGIFSTEKSEKNALISYEASLIVTSVQSSDFLEKSSLLNSIEKLQQYANESDSAFEQSSGILGMGLASLPALEKKGNSPTYSDCVQASSDYFSKMHLDSWSHFVQNSSTATNLNKEQTALQTLYSTLESKTISGEAKGAALRSFFTTYPTLAQNFASLFGQKIELFYEFFEKENRHNSLN